MCTLIPEGIGSGDFSGSAHGEDAAGACWLAATRDALETSFPTADT